MTVADIATAINTALGTLSLFSGQTLQYELTAAGPWVAFPAGVSTFLEAHPPQVMGYDGERNAILAPQTATLKVGLGATILTPGSTGSFVKDQIGTAWAIMGLVYGEAEVVYSLMRSTEERQGTVRGVL